MTLMVVVVILGLGREAQMDAGREREGERGGEKKSGWNHLTKTMDGLCGENSWHARACLIAILLFVVIGGLRNGKMAIVSTLLQQAGRERHVMFTES